MFSPALREYLRTEERETGWHVIMLSLCHSYVEEGLRVYKLGVVGNNCLRVGVLSYTHMDTGGCIAGSVAPVASNLDHNIQFVCGGLFCENTFMSEVPVHRTHNICWVMGIRKRSMKSQREYFFFSPARFKFNLKLSGCSCVIWGKCFCNESWCHNSALRSQIHLILYMPVRWEGKERLEKNWKKEKKKK